MITETTLNHKSLPKLPSSHLKLCWILEEYSNQQIMQVQNVIWTATVDSWDRCYTQYNKNWKHALVVVGNRFEYLKVLANCSERKFQKQVFINCLQSWIKVAVRGRTAVNRWSTPPLPPGTALQLFRIWNGGSIISGRAAPHLLEIHAKELTNASLKCSN